MVVARKLAEVIVEGYMGWSSTRTWPRDAVEQGCRKAAHVTWIDIRKLRSGTTATRHKTARHTTGGRELTFSLDTAIKNTFRINSKNQNQTAKGNL